MADTVPLIDNWSSLDHKRILSRKLIKGQAFEAPSWVGKEHERRLIAYILLDAYTKNSARHFIFGEAEDIDNRREYGDAATIVDATLAALLGEDQTISVEGAEAYDPDLGEDAEPAKKAINAAAQRAAEREDELIDWANSERFQLKLHETERDACKLGDGVYVISWSSTRGRPRLRCYDPGFYFPVLHDTAEDEFPTRIHLAWEINDDDPNVTRVRRITYDLAPIKPLFDEVGYPRLNDDGNRLLYPEGVTFNEADQPQIQLPYNDKPVSRMCYMSDAVYTIDPAKQTIDDFSPESAVWQINEDGQVIRDLYLGIDFIPVIHVPNTIAEKDHFGQSAMARVLQLLDDLSAADSDLAKAAATSGSPAIGISTVAPPTARVPTKDKEDFTAAERVRQFFGANASLPKNPRQFGPGAIISAPGNIELLSTEGALDPLSNLVLHLLDRLSVNTRLPASVLGRTKPSEVPSGIALALSFGPLKSMIAQMRLIRQEKYSLALKFVQRFLMLDGKFPAGADNILRAEVVLGNYLPADQTAVIEAVRNLVQAKAISRQTALRMLIEAGVPIDDANEEIARIKAEDLETAIQLYEATGDANVLADRGIDVTPVPGPDEVPQIVLPEIPAE